MEDNRVKKNRILNAFFSSLKNKYGWAEQFGVQKALSYIGALIFYNPRILLKTSSPFEWPVRGLKLEDEGELDSANRNYQDCWLNYRL